MSEEPAGNESKGKGVSPWLVLAGLAAVLLAVMWFKPLGGSDRGASHKGVGKPLPNLRFVPLTYTVDAVDTSQLRGSVAVINFWGTWCGPCRVEFPHLVELYQQYRQRDDFKLVAVSCGSGLDEQLQALSEGTAAFLASMGAELPTYADPNGAARMALDQAIGFDSYPTTLVVDRQGTIRGVWIGYKRGYEVEVERLVASLLVSG